MEDGDGRVDAEPFELPAPGVARPYDGGGAMLLELELLRVSMRGGSSFTRFGAARFLRWVLSSPSFSLPPARLRDVFGSAATEDPDGLTERPPGCMRGGGGMERRPSGELAWLRPFPRSTRSS